MIENKLFMYLFKAKRILAVNLYTKKLNSVSLSPCSCYEFYLPRRVQNELTISFIYHDLLNSHTLGP